MGYRSFVPLLIAVALLLGCGESETTPVVVPGAGGAGGGDGTCPPGEHPNPAGGCCPAGTAALDDGSCQPAGLPPDMQCPPGETELEDGSCQPAGVPPDGCGDGFVHDGDRGCEPILPDDPCPPGLMAVPGDTECREVAPCGDGTWGDIPVEPSTQYVDGSYQGGDSDGSADKPWTTVQAGIDAAHAGAIVAVATGTYAEDLDIQDKPVRVWGRCPAQVEVQGTGADYGAVDILGDANGTEIRDLAITGAALGVLVSDSQQVLLDRLWIHDTLKSAVDVEDTLGPTSVLVHGSLIEGSHGCGVFVSASDASLEATVVRETQPAENGQGWGVLVQDSDTGERANVTLYSSLVEKNHVNGVAVYGSDTTIEATVVRETQPAPNDDRGRGIAIHASPGTEERANVTIRSSLVEKNHDHGVIVSGSDAIIDATVVRETQPVPTIQRGRGVTIQYSPSTLGRADVTVRSSLVEKNHDHGVAVLGSDATIEATVVRETLLNQNGDGGRGITIHASPVTEERANATVRSSLVEMSYEHGVLVGSSDATIEATVVRDTQLDQSGELGMGVIMLATSDMGERANATVRGTLIENNHIAGVFVLGSDASLEATVVRETQPNQSGNGGWGVYAQYLDTGQRAGVTVHSSLVEKSHQFGVFVVGSDATIEATVVHDTQPDQGGDYGMGLVTMQDEPTGELANVTVRGTLVEKARDAGVLMRFANATIEHSVIEETLPRPSDGAYGTGLVCDHTDLLVDTTVVRNSRVAAVAAWSCAGHITDSLLEDVLAGHFFAWVDHEPVEKYENVADGLLASYGSDVTLTNTRIENCVRAGILYDNSSGALSNVVSTNNRFGMSLQGDPFPTYDETCSFEGNIEKDILSDGNLPVPNAPPEMPEPP